MCGGLVYNNMRESDLGLSLAKPSAISANFNSLTHDIIAKCPMIPTRMAQTWRVLLGVLISIGLCYPKGNGVKAGSTSKSVSMIVSEVLHACGARPINPEPTVARY